MIRTEIKRLKSAGPREMRNFGLTVGGVLIAAGLFFWWRHKPWCWWFVIGGVLMVVAAVVAPRCLRAIYVGWMALGLALGTVVSTVLLTVCFYMIVIPLALVARLLGRDFLERRIDRRTTTYWRLRPDPQRKPKRRHEQQF